MKTILTIEEIRQVTKPHFLPMSHDQGITIPVSELWDIEKELKAIGFRPKNGWTLAATVSLKDNLYRVTYTWSSKTKLNGYVFILCRIKAL